MCIRVHEIPGGSVIKNPPANAGDTGLILESGRSPGVGNGNPLQYSCLGNSMDRGIWRVRDHGVTKSQTQVSVHTHTTSSTTPVLQVGLLIFKHIGALGCN